MSHADAVLQDDHGRTVLRFERSLSHPPERVWRFLTDWERLSAWHPTPFELEARPGGAVRYLSSGDAPGVPDGEVAEYDPPRVLAYTWGEDLLRWELQARGDGCLLVLTQTFDDRFKAARDAAGWHLCLDALAGLLDGREPESARDADGRPVGWDELNGAYEERFGIPADKATPPPG